MDLCGGGCVVGACGGWMCFGMFKYLSACSCLVLFRTLCLFGQLVGFKTFLPSGKHTGNLNFTLSVNSVYC
jgi:hypothetical protein